MRVKWVYLHACECDLRKAQLRKKYTKRAMSCDTYQTDHKRWTNKHNASYDYVRTWNPSTSPMMIAHPYHRPVLKLLCTFLHFGTYVPPKGGWIWKDLYGVTLQCREMRCTTNLGEGRESECCIGCLFVYWVRFVFCQWQSSLWWSWKWNIVCSLWYLNFSIFFSIGM